jgi:aryl-alcohol dehydrogenase-like predicted oxidoreductase
MSFAVPSIQGGGRDNHTRPPSTALGGEKPIDLWQHHSPDPNVPVEESLKAAKEAVDDGLVRFVGVSNYSVEQIERAREVVEIVSVQNQYSPWHRQPEQDGVLDYCEREGLTFLAFSPLGGSSRAKELTQYKGIVRLTEEKGISPQRLVLAWLITKSPRVLPIPGPRRVETAEDSIHAVDVSLSEEDVATIDEAAA